MKKNPQKSVRASLAPSVFKNLFLKKRDGNDNEKGRKKKISSKKKRSNRMMVRSMMPINRRLHKKTASASDLQYLGQESRKRYEIEKRELLIRKLNFLSQDVKKTYFDFKITSEKFLPKGATFRINKNKTEYSVQEALKQNLFDKNFLKKMIHRKITEEELKELTSIHLACLFGDHKKLEKLIDGGRDPNRINRFKKMPLNYCLESKSYKCFKLLFLRAPTVELNEIDHKGYSLFMQSCRRRLPKIFNLLFFSPRNIDYKIVAGKKDIYELVKTSKSKEIREVFVAEECNRTIFKRLLLRKSPFVVPKLLQKRENLGFLTMKEHKEILQMIVDEKKCNCFLIPFLKKGITVSPDLISSERKSKFGYDTLKVVHDIQRLERIFLELLKTEKSFFDDCYIIENLFEKMQFLNKELVKNTEVNYITGHLCFAISLIRQNSQKFIWDMSNAIGDSKTFYEKKRIAVTNNAISKLNTEKIKNDYRILILKSFLELKLEQFSYFEDQLQAFNKLGRHLKMIEKVKGRLQKYIPFPKVQNFDVFMGKCRLRLVEYQNLFDRALKYTRHDPFLDKLLFQASQFVKKNLNMLNDKMNDNMVQEMTIKMKKVLKQRFKYDLDSNSRYIFHLEKQKFTSIKSPNGENRKFSNKEGDIFVFDDLLLFGFQSSVSGLQPKFFPFKDYKICFLFNLLFCKIMIFEKGRVKSDLQFIHYMNDQDSLAFYEALLNAYRRDFCCYKTSDDESDAIRTFLKD